MHFDDAAGQQQVIAHRPLCVAGTGEMGDRTGDTWRGVLIVIQQCQAVEAVAHLRIGKAPGQRLLVGRQHADRKAGGALEGGQALRMQRQVPQHQGRLQ